MNFYKKEALLDFVKRNGMEGFEAEIKDKTEIWLKSSQAETYLLMSIAQARLSIFAICVHLVIQLVFNWPPGLCR